MKDTTYSTRELLLSIPVMKHIFDDLPKRNEIYLSILDYLIQNDFTQEEVPLKSAKEVHKDLGLSSGKFKKNLDQIYDDIIELLSDEGYKYLDFGDEKRETMQVCLTVRPVSKGTIEVYADEPNSGQLLGKIEVSSFSHNWTDYTATVNALSGIHSIYFVFNSEGKVLGDFSYFSFT